MNVLNISSEQLICCFTEKWGRTRNELSDTVVPHRTLKLSDDSGRAKLLKRNTDVIIDYDCLCIVIDKYVGRRAIFVVGRSEKYVFKYNYFVCVFNFALRLSCCTCSVSSTFISCLQMPTEVFGVIVEKLKVLVFNDMFIEILKGKWD